MKMEILIAMSKDLFPTKEVSLIKGATLLVPNLIKMNKRAMIVKAMLIPRKHYRKVSKMRIITTCPKNLLLQHKMAEMLKTRNVGQLTIM